MTNGYHQSKFSAWAVASINQVFLKQGHKKLYGAQQIRHASGPGSTNTQEDVDVEMQTWPPSRNHDNDLDKVSNVDSDEVSEVKVETGVTLCMSTIVDAPLIVSL
ncbi:hypothetical protein EI94DRAFT_1707493 [Lactarius quietus]|nr:hypothetical protein EI94DRAFT_1707493 [Lactarius quietus]